MRCAACHRPLKKPAVRHGFALFGPKCAARLALSPGKKAVVGKADAQTPDLFEGEKGPAA